MRHLNGNATQQFLTPGEDGKLMACTNVAIVTECHDFAYNAEGKVEKSQAIETFEFITDSATLRRLGENLIAAADRADALEAQTTQALL